MTTSNALEFLKTVAQPGEHMAVIAIDPKTGRCTGRGFQLESIDEIEAFIEENRQRNRYWTPNPLLTRIDKKPSKRDVAKMRRAYVDIDENVDTALERLRSAPLLPTFIVFSGGGFQAFWDLFDPVQVNGNLEELEGINRRLIDYFGGDQSAWNLDRIMRLPGTDNWPTKTKLAKGRSPDPVQAYLVEHHPERQYRIEDFAVFKTETLPESSTKVVALFNKKSEGAAGTHDSTPSRSEDLLAQVSSAKQAGKTRSEICKLYILHPHAADQADPRRAVERAIDKVEADEAELIEGMNRRFALIMVEGKLHVMWRKEWGSGLPQMSSVDDTRRILLPEKQGRAKNPVDTWLAHPNRAFYSGIVFAPGVADTGNKFNLFRGWAVTPMQGDCSLFLRHLREVICDGDEDLFDYVVQWLANLFQFPRERPGTSIALNSGEGAGKGAVARYLKHILGTHQVQLSSSAQLLGEFNDFLASALLVFGDEVMWAGDKKGANKLKAYITEDHIFINRKYLPGFSGRSYVRFITATNHEHSAPAGIDARRYVVLPVSEKFVGDHSYWSALENERSGDGPAALLHYLLHEVKLTRNLREVPKTAALVQQKLLSLDAIGEYWRAMLMENDHQLTRGSGANYEVIARWRFGEVVQTTVLHTFYLDHARNRRAHPVSIDALGKGLRRYVSDLSKREATAVERRALGHVQRTAVYDLPNLEEARRQFEEVLGQRVDWPEPAMGNRAAHEDPDF